MTMVERVARAIAEALRFDFDQNDSCRGREEPFQEEFLSAARAAIEAMRDAAGPEWAAVIDAALDMPVRGDLSPVQRDLGGEG